MQDVLAKLNDFAGRFLIFTPDNPLFEALFSEGFSLGYPKNNGCALNLDDMGTIIQWQGKENREIAQSTIALLSKRGIIWITLLKKEDAYVEKKIDDPGGVPEAGIYLRQ